MEISKETLEKLKSLSDEQLKSAIGDIADALGATPRQKQKAQNNSRMIKKKLAMAREGDILKHFGKISPEQQNEILRKLRF